MFEDNIENLTVQRTLLEYEGAEVHVFFGGNIKNITDLLPLDAIIMDLMLPGGLSGFDFYAKLREIPELSSIPVVAVSAMDASLAVSKSKSMGFAGFIAKPVDVDQFANQITSIINGATVWDANRR